MNGYVLAALWALAVVVLTGWLNQKRNTKVDPEKKHVCFNLACMEVCDICSPGWRSYPEGYILTKTFEELSTDVCKKLPLSVPYLGDLEKNKLYTDHKACYLLAIFFGFRLLMDRSNDGVTVVNFRGNAIYVDFLNFEEDVDPYLGTNIAILCMINEYY